MNSKIRLFGMMLLIGSSIGTLRAQSDSVKHWTIKGENTLLLNQTAFSSWAAGGINSFGGTLGLNYDFNYKKDTWNWDNKFIIGYGLTKQSDVGWRKSDDRLILNSLLGKEYSKKWMYTFFLNFQTQFSNGYDYTLPGEPLISGFFAPAYLGFGPGIAYKESDNFKMNLSPLASRMTFVSNDTLSQQGAFGVDPGSKFKYELGAYFELYYKKEIWKNISAENSLKLFSNYLDKPKNVDIDYTLNILMKVNDYISANLGLQMVYDDDTKLPYDDNGEIRYRSRLQVKQLFGVGITYKF
ncbi:MAG: DUF3078 domain-containing protein [Candidatus Azobacteroides sp.]|nr:DUF3078 domain-containing protein [Candidatus Azobacteroides sp.]